MTDFSRPALLNLSDLYLTRKDFADAQRQIARKIGRSKRTTFALTVAVFLLACAISGQRERINTLECAIKLKDETAG